MRLWFPASRPGRTTGCRSGSHRGKTGHPSGPDVFQIAAVRLRTRAPGATGHEFRAQAHGDPGHADDHEPAESVDDVEPARRTRRPLDQGWVVQTDGDGRKAYGYDRPGGQARRHPDAPTSPGLARGNEHLKVLRPHLVAERETGIRASHAQTVAAASRGWPVLLETHHNGCANPVITTDRGPAYPRVIDEPAVTARSVMPGRSGR